MAPISDWLARGRVGAEQMANIWCQKIYDKLNNSRLFYMM